MNYRAAQWVRVAVRTNPKLAPGARFIAHVLAGYANSTGLAWPSLAELVEQTGLGRRSIIRHIAALEIAGIFEVDRTAGRGNRYRFPAAVDLSTDQCQPSTSAKLAPVPPATDTSATVARDQCQAVAPVTSNEVCKERASTICPTCGELCDEDGRWRHRRCEPLPLAVNGEPPPRSFLMHGSSYGSRL